MEIHYPQIRKASRSSAGSGFVQGFTLLELMTVLAIMSILSFLTLPTLVGLSSADNLDTGGSMVVGLANQARQNSIAKGVMTILVMVTNAPQTNLNNRLFLLLDMEQQDGSSTYAWTPISRWYALPEGVMVDTSRSNFAQATFQPVLPQALSNVTYLGTPILPSNCVYQVFMPGGELNVKGYSVLQAPNLRLAKESNGVLIGQGTVNYYNILFNLYTGTSTIDRP